MVDRAEYRPSEAALSSCRTRLGISQKALRTAAKTVYLPQT